MSLTRVVQATPWLGARGLARQPRPVTEATWYFQGRILLNKQNIPSPSGGSMQFKWPDVFWQAANPFVGNNFTAGNKDYLFIMNTHPSLPRTVIIYSYPEPVFGRVGNVCITVDPFSENNNCVIAYPIPKLGFMQLDGTIWLLGQTEDILFLPLTFS
ncbi:MAG TPA: hypothetical protein VK816_04860 [Jatrophihabitantaceae bacterium]|jgi:hypothetical protein|nr:hypothetical protein [Jatrophihabitantaceae bacterium]